MSSELPWFRMYHEFIADPVIRLLAFDDQRHYVFVLCMKARGDLDKDYANADLRERAIALQLGLSSVAALDAKSRLVESALIDVDWQPLGWEKRQMRSDSSADRARRYRERQRANGVTSPSRDGHGVDTEEERDTDIPPTAPTEQCPPGAPPTASESKGTKGKSARERATRLPETFTLTVERRAIAAAENLPNPERVFEKFVNHWRAKSGQQARKLDWDATWRNWCMTEADRSRAPVPRQRGGLSPGSSSTSWRPR